MPQVAVLTGDLIDSSRAAPAEVDAAMTCLGAAAREIAARARTDARFSRFRGDGWQMVLENPSDSLRATLLLTARLRAADLDLATRIAIGIGAVDSLGTRNLGDATGPAFVTSGHLLDGLPHDRRLAIAGPKDPDQPAFRQLVTPLHEAILALVEQQSQRWTAAQAEAVALSLIHPGRTHAQLAAQLGVTRQAVQSRLASAGAAALEPALRAFELYPWEAAS
ncbi:hypothetical protein [Frigidibacter sp. ROC022]|uniref:hypothetical protein n=1 Tax=Frigidibacter sp. ROC022 TaxID=2971796 RepID=UPI00215A8B4F|nr:hypothetical protein [Frigidibacter sp. ROC022]MCR8723883.1 hypothetical protein [Frigidibacter sp. ROC022]